MKRNDRLTIDERLAWRREALLLCHPPVVLEMFGGWGQIGHELYRGYPGIVYERDRAKVEELARRRPEWAVYQGLAVDLARIGAGRHLTPTLVDLDPYGSPWAALRAWFTSEREHVLKLVVVATDGLYRAVQAGSTRDEELRQIIEHYGSDTVRSNYGGVSHALIEGFAALAGYRVEEWRWSPGKQKQAFWLAVLER